jgi:hypothetical protein
MFTKRFFTAAALGLAMLAGAAVPAYASSYRSCERRVRRAEARLNDAIRHHGFRSRQAQERRYELQRERAGCRYDGRRGW